MVENYNLFYLLSVINLNDEGAEDIAYKKLAGDYSES